MQGLSNWSVLFAQNNDAAGAAGGIIGIVCGCGGGLLGLVMFGLWIWMLIDCITKEPSIPGNNDKLIWILVVALAGGIGALIYYFVRRPKRIAQYGK